MRFMKQTFALTSTALRSIGHRPGSSLVTIVGVTTVVAVLVSLLAMSEGASIFTGEAARPDEVAVLGRGAEAAPQSVLSREAALAVNDAPYVRHTPDGRPYTTASSMVNVDAIKKDGTRGRIFIVGWTPGVELVQPDVKIVEGRNYKPAVHEVTVSDPIRKMYRGMDIGDRINLRGTEWTVVGVFAGSDTLGDSVLRADADTVMSTFGRTMYQQVLAILESPADIPAFKKVMEDNPAIAVDVKTIPETFKAGFGQLNSLIDFLAYFVGVVMASGAVFGALNSLYASVDARRRELATLRAIGFSGGPIILSVLIEGMVLALPGAFVGSAIAWAFFNGHVVSPAGLIFKLTVTPHTVWVAVLWSLAIGLIGASLPALRAVRVPVATAMRDT
jgi:putative ABC transport system permease protein